MKGSLLSRKAPAEAELEPSPRTSWKRIVMQAFGMWFATRVAFVLFTYVTVVLNGYGNQRIQPGFVVGRWSISSLVIVWFRWDAGFFTDIAQHGYSLRPQAAFFPLYPLLIKGLTFVIGGHLLAASLIISNLAALAAFVGVGLLAAREHGLRASPAAIRMLAAYPLAFFTVAPYSDALLLATAAFTLYWARQRRWPLVALSAFLAGLSRSSALILWLPILWEYGRDRDWWRRAAWNRSRIRAWFVPRAIGETVMVLGALPLAFILYMVYLGRRFGDPLLAFRAHALYWNRHLQPVWLTLKHAIGLLLKDPFGTYWSILLAVDLGVALTFIAITIIGARREPLSFTLYMSGLLLLSLSAPILLLADPLSSVGRELLVSIPAFLLLARWARRWPSLEMLLVTGGFLLQAALATYFLSGGWVE